jgi:hypothetical protein
VSGSFLDTTVLVGLSEFTEPTRSNSQQFVDSHQPSEAGYYASRELLAGPVQYICDAHNVLLGAQNHTEAMLAIRRRIQAAGRKREVPLQVLIESLNEIFGTGKAGTPADYKREALQAIMIKGQQLWYRANTLKNVRRVQQLACFNSGDISIGEGGELRGPNNSFNCLATERCAAAGYLSEAEAALTKLIEALRPAKLDKGARGKGENVSRRKALKQIKALGPKLFSKRHCRAIGDAYFAVMCPAGSIIATTNLRDFEPLCKALGKQAEKP